MEPQNTITIFDAGDCFGIMIELPDCDSLEYYPTFAEARAYALTYANENPNMTVWYDVPDSVLDAFYGIS